jgi:hypothetical protein
MNRKAYGILLVITFLAVGFLTSCSSNSTPLIIPTTPFAFYLSGQDALPAGSGNVNFYALAGAVTITPTGKVTAGEQDYNDANSANGGVTSPEPGGDLITGGSLTVDSTTGQGTLTLITNNPALGVNGTETLGVQFVNDDHALITQFDGSATSSGSLDLQTLPSTPSGGFAFTLAGVDPDLDPVAIGGVFSIGGSGTIDINDDGSVLTGTAFTPVLSTPDAFGRGTISGVTVPGGTIAVNYYIVGAEAVRIIDVDATDSLVGSAFGQGTNATAATNASLSGSVLAISNGSNGYGSEFGALGQFATNSTPTPATFTGVGDSNELDNGVLSGLASSISGTYSIAANGYGSLTIGGLGDITALQVYLTDPALNISDPNNTSGGGGGLVLDLDDSLAGGLGVLIPQTDTTSTDFNGNYAAGWQNFNYFTECGDCESDMVAQGSMASGGALSLTGLVSDPFETLTAGAITETGATFTGTPAADPNNAGRFSMLSANENELTTVIGTSEWSSWDVVMYQASAGQLFWLNYDDTDTSVFLGPLEQQPSSLTLPAAIGPVAKPQTRQKP